MDDQFNCQEQLPIIDDRSKYKLEMRLAFNFLGSPVYPVVDTCTRKSSQPPLLAKLTHEQCTSKLESSNVQNHGRHIAYPSKKINQLQPLND